MAAIMPHNKQFPRELEVRGCAALQKCEQWARASAVGHGFMAQTEYVEIGGNELRNH